jgi:hypothetical protein
MERPTRRLDLPAFPRSRSRSSQRHPGQLALSRLRRMGRLQLLVLLLQIGSLGLMIRMALVEPRPFCRLQQWSSSARPGTWPSTHLN